MELHIKLILAFCLIQVLGVIFYVAWMIWVRSRCYAPNGAPGSCKKEAEVCNDCMHQFADTCVDEERESEYPDLWLSSWGCNGQGPIITIRRHESAHMPGENPEAYRYMVRNEYGCLMMAGVEHTFLAASLAVERYLKALEKEKQQ